MSVKINGSTGIDTIQDKVYNATGVKNWIINGQFDVWQRGTSATSSGYNADDRWYNDHSVSTKTISKQAFAVGQTDVPNNPTYFSRTVVSSGNTSSSYTEKIQKIEDVTKLSGKTVSVSFWAKADSSKNISIEIYQFFGSGGSAVVYNIGVQKFSLTTTWQRFTKTITLPSITGKTIGSGSFLGTIFWLDAGSNFNSHTDSLGNQSGTFDIANVCLVEGSTAMECPSEPYAEVLRKCQRYYYRIGGTVETEILIPAGYINSSTIAVTNVLFPIQMRVPPTSIDYSSIQMYDSSMTMYTATNPSINGAGLMSMQVNVTISAGTAGRFAWLRSSNSAIGYIAFNAEL